MKKIILSVMVCAFSAFSFAQQGVFEVGGAVGFNSSSVKTPNLDGGEDKVSTSSISILPSFMYGISDKLSIGASLGFTYEKDKDKDKTSLFVIQPTLRYSIPITENFSYAPQFFVGFGFGTLKFDEEGAEDADLMGFNVGLNLVRFSYTISPKMGLAFSCGNLEYNYSQAKVNDYKVKTNNFGLGINIEPTLGFYYTF